MTLKPCGIRLWALAISLGGVMLFTAAVRLEAQPSSSPVPASSSPSVIQSLLDKAHALELRGRIDLAEQTWQQVLLTDPKNTEALAGLARSAKLNNSPALAKSYLDRLRAINPNDPNLAQIEGMIAGKQNQQSELQQAAKLAEAGNYANAVIVYRHVFGTNPPPGDWALAYYETEAATEDGRPHAVAGLRALLDNEPANTQYRIALGRVLTYDPATREEGREYLASFPNDTKAAEAFRQSLLWDVANPVVQPQIRAYLTDHQDPQLAAALQSGKPPAAGPSALALAPIHTPAPTPSAPAQAVPTGAAQAAAPPSKIASAVTATPAPAAPSPSTVTPSVAVANAPPAPAPAPARTPVPSPSDGASTRTRAAELAAYQALNADHVDQAESDFKAILATSPQNPAALAGMGYVRMQQGNFSGAIGFLEQAKQYNPNDKGVASALDTARFWFIMGEGQHALNDNDLTTAERRYRSALDLRPNSVDALEGLGGTLTKAQQPTAAIPLFQRAVAADPASAIGWRGLFIAQVQSGNAVLALATDKQVPAAVHAQLMSDPLYLASLAAAYSATGQTGDAQKTLEGALKLPAPADAKGVKAGTQLQLAALLISENHLDQAEPLYVQAIGDNDENAAAWQGLVSVQHAQAHDRDALRSVVNMPPAVYASALRDPAFPPTVASIYASQKMFDEAQQVLEKAIAQQSKPSPELQMQLAGLYVQRGNPQLATSIYLQLIRENPNLADAWAGLVSTLHATGNDAQAADRIKTIPPPVRAQLETNAAYLQTMASVYQALGRSREAAPYLNRVEQNYAAESKDPPADVQIQNAWALYNGMEDADLYRQLLDLGNRTDLTPDQRKTVQTIWTNWALRRANLAAVAGNQRRALAILNAAAQAFPDNPAAIKALAPGYTQAGEPHQAVLIYRAQNLSSASSADYQAAIGAALADGDNRDAEAWLRYALKAYPSDPQVLLLGARFEQARGDAARAIDYYHASLKAMPSGAKPPAEPGPPAASAPAGLPSPNQPQDLVILLAPDSSDPPASAPVPTAPRQSKPPTDDSPVSPYGGTSKAMPPSQSSGDAYGSYAASIPPPAAAPAASPDRGVTGRSVLPVQLGDKTPPPVQQQTDMTDVLPTPRYAPSARAAEAARAEPEAAAARAARIRQLQQDAAARTGTSHPLNEDTVAAATFNADYTPAQIAQSQDAPQVPRPTTGPTGQFSDIPNTGAQQYPQPRTPPTPSRSTNVSRSRPAPETPLPTPATTPIAATPSAIAPSPAEPTPAPPPQPAPPVASAPAPVYPPLAPPYPLAPPPTDAELQAHNLPALGGLFAAQAPIPMSSRQQAENELASLEGAYSGWFGVTGIGRYRAGTVGLDRLYDAEAPVEASAVIDRTARLTAVALPVFLDSGQLNTAKFTTGYVPYLGTLPANAAIAPAQQYSYGVGGELQLTTRDLGLSAGYTPYKFLVHNLTGRFHFSTLGGHLSLFGTRDPVKDTQLSYAGLRDPGAASPGPIWGGVIATTGGVRLSFGSSRANFYLSASDGELTGRHVLSNTMFQGATGAGFRVGNWPGYGALTVGYTLAGMHYQHNEAGLSYGQGGYFSPGSYVLAAVPITFNGRYKTNFHYAIAGGLGVQTFEQEEAPFYPLDPALQSAFKPSNGIPCTAAQTPSYNCGQYSRQDSTLFNYSINAEAAYRFAGHWYGGGYLSANNTSNYDAVSAGFFFRYVFSAKHSDEGFPSGLFHLQGLRPLQIP